MNNKLVGFVKFLIGWPLAIAAIIFVLKLASPKFSEVLSFPHTINYYLLLLSFLAFILYFISRSYLWMKILEFKGNKLPLKVTSYLWGFSEFKRYVPGNVWSFFSRVSLFSDVGVDKKVVGFALLDEIQLIVIPCAILSLFSFPLILSLNSDNLIRMEEILLGSFVGIILYILAVAYLLKKRMQKGNMLSNLYLPGYSLKEKIQLSLIAAISFFMFGAATLISSLAVFSFSPALFFPLACFYVMALLVGYLSFITPTGLGVREGVIIIGLSSLVSLANASFIAIFTRLALVISELIFLIIIFTVKKL